MGRTVAFPLITDTSHFTPLQMQPRTLLQVSFGALSRWLKEHLVSFPQLIARERLSVVILGSAVHYEEPLRFFDCDQVDVEASLRVLRAGTRMQLDVDFRGPRARAAKVSILLCPVRIEDEAALGASPTQIDGPILERFQKDEVEEASPARPLPELCRQIEQDGRVLARGTSPFTVHRHLCEVADQWAFFEVPALVGTSRECMVQADGAKIPALRETLAQPMRHFDMELVRPFFWFQTGRVETTAYEFNRHIALIHRLLSSVPGGELHGTIIERF